MVDIVKRGRLSEEDEEVAAFLSQFEEWWFRPQLWIDRAHVTMLAEQGIVPTEDAIAILSALDDVEADGFAALPERGDLHVAIEESVVDRLGEDIGGRMHTARSRNDKGATAMRIAFREELLTLAEELLSIEEVLVDRADEMSDWLVSGYTHLQNAQPTTVGHHLLGYAEAFSRDFERVIEGFDRTNRNPLGSAALAGTGFDIDRERTTELLGFEAPTRNSMDSVATRDFALDALGAASATATDVTRLSEDLYLWSSHEFGFVEIHDRHAGSSSIMPQKKNPDTAEVARARAGRVVGMHAAALHTLKALPMAFNFDIVETAVHGREALRVVRDSVRIIRATVGDAIFDKDRMEQGANEGFSTATELADTMVRETNIAFRTAHHIVGRLAREYHHDAITSERVDEVAKEIVGSPLGINEAAIERALDPRYNVEVRDSVGGPGEVPVAVQDVRSRLENQYKALHDRSERLVKARERLEEARTEL